MHNHMDKKLDDADFFGRSTKVEVGNEPNVRSVCTDIVQ